MNIQVLQRKIDTDRVELSVTLPTEETDAQIERALIAIAYQQQVTPGENETPEDAVYRKLGRQEAEELITNMMISYLTPFAITDAGVETIGAPVIRRDSPAQEGQDFTFSIGCVLKPHFSLSSYDPVSITVPPLEVTEQEIDDQIQKLVQDGSSQETDTSHEDIRKGDTVELSLETTMNGERYENLCTESRDYETGAGLMPEEFDDAICTMKIGETKTISYDVKGFLGDVDSQPVDHYQSVVTAKRIVKSIVPLLTDEWVKENVPDCENISMLRDKLRAQILEAKTKEYRHYKNLLCANEIVKRFEGDIPEAVFEVMSAEVRRGFDEQLAQQGMTREEFLRQQNVNELQLENELRRQTRTQLIKQFALDAVADYFDLDVDDDALDEYFRTAGSPGLESMMRLDFERSSRMYVANEAALRLKANDYLRETAVVTVVPSK